jgi:hypothetical protein
MPSTTNLELKKFISRAILAGLIGTAAVFVYVLFLPKQYEIIGKIVVYPVGSQTAQKNLGLEVGNTVEIIDGSAFKKNYFQGVENNFLKVRERKNSSVIEVIFLSTLSERIAVEDAIAGIPQAVSDYARDLYGGSPFKYKLLSDPEISPGPARPNLYKFLGGGFAIGAILFFLYWLFFEFLKIPEGRDEASAKSLPMSAIPSVDFQPEKSVDEIEAAVEEEIAEPYYAYSEPVFETPAIPESPFLDKAEPVAPDNLPVLDMEPKNEAKIAQKTTYSPVSGYQEPTDEEVKDRLNKLMRGEL